MKLTKHHSILVIADNYLSAMPAHVKAKEMFSDIENEPIKISNMIGGDFSQQQVFYIYPEINSEGWETSYKCLEIRNNYLKWLGASSGGNIKLMTTNPTTKK